MHQLIEENQSVEENQPLQERNKSMYLLRTCCVRGNQYHSWFYYKPLPHNFDMLEYLKKERKSDITRPKFGGSCKLLLNS